MDFELHLKLFLEDIFFNIDNNNKFYEINFFNQKEKLERIYYEHKIENYYVDDYNTFIENMNNYISDNGIKTIYLDNLNVLVNFIGYMCDRNILMIVID